MVVSAHRRHSRLNLLQYRTPYRILEDRLGRLAQSHLA